MREITRNPSALPPLTAWLLFFALVCLILGIAIGYHSRSQIAHEGPTGSAAIERLMKVEKELVFAKLETAELGLRLEVAELKRERLSKEVARHEADSDNLRRQQREASWQKAELDALLWTAKLEVMQRMIRWVATADMALDALLPTPPDFDRLKLFRFHSGGFAKLGDWLEHWRNQKNGKKDR